MARSKDEGKRSAILQSSKKLFAQKGFFNTSIADITGATGLPTGSIYTYFTNKEEIVRVIVDEGWSDLRDRLESSLRSAQSSQARLRVLIDDFLPELLTDFELINILLSEAIDYTKIEEKVEQLTEMILAILKEISPEKKTFHQLDRRAMKTGLIVYFLGVLNAVKISRETSLGISVDDITAFLRQSIENSMDVEL
jgi:AcrR family transcriptional regulator